MANLVDPGRVRPTVWTFPVCAWSDLIPSLARQQVLGIRFAGDTLVGACEPAWRHYQIDPACATWQWWMFAITNFVRRFLSDCSDTKPFHRMWRRWQRRWNDFSIPYADCSSVLILEQLRTGNTQVEYVGNFVLRLSCCWFNTCSSLCITVERFP